VIDSCDGSEDDSDDDEDEVDDDVEVVETTEPISSEQDLHHYKPLNADQILQQIVERKCHESNSTFNLDTVIAVSELNIHMI
jgi:hypothetical protein